jgi:hypothetical protein
MNDKMKAAMQKYEAEKVITLARIDTLLEEEMLDEDGYPSDAALEIVRIWPFDGDIREWFDFIKSSIWWASDWGWHQGEQPHDYDADKKVYRYSISTGGWSGNESIIRAMESNSMMWHLHWVQSRRGGHYIFELRD